MHSWRIGVGAVLLGLITVMAIAAPLLAPFDPMAISGPPLLPPDASYLLGTDMLGRDVLSGMIHGARVSLIVGLVSALCSAGIGITVGAIAGYFGGAIDRALVRFTEFFQVIPSFMFVILLVAILTPSLLSITLAISVVIWPPVARLVRSEFLTLKTREFVEAARSLGLSHGSVIVREILPNAMPPVLAVGSLMVATAILTEASLSFLGLADPNMTSWGYMIGSARPVFRHAWWLSVFPGLLLFLTVLSITLLSEGLGDKSNPSLRGQAGH
ncbi:ABC transporter permease [Oceanibacterium hippocampi]|uniref:Glutathione transport system permease protein GsiD n=1 Tax=Oceanibacterium hippocampi TaxID=745714 RepID=A0A1Y5TLJ0_9PROT|nr:ABC transporter permease [Oceanibacterium hippocampi]SLN66699.1 Glutathione transport system permease protein GsiD [Oceanibacterium hippocampi]